VRAYTTAKESLQERRLTPDLLDHDKVNVVSHLWGRKHSFYIYYIVTDLMRLNLTVVGTRSSVYRKIEGEDIDLRRMVMLVEHVSSELRPQVRSLLSTSFRLESSTKTSIRATWSSIKTPVRRSSSTSNTLVSCQKTRQSRSKQISRGC